MNVTIYSKEDCSPCIRTKLLLKQRGIAFKENKIDVNDPEKIKEVTDIMASFGVEFRSLPQVIIDGNYVGGFENVLKYLNEHRG